MISKRIQTLASMIPENCTGVFDVGSDHGYLLNLIRETNSNINLCGIENKKGPYNNLLKGVKNKNIESYLSDGLDLYNSKYNLVVLAGMGYQNICNIINKNINKIDFIEYFLIDSHNFIPSIRTFFINLGYFIENEKIINENNIFYELILFKKGYKNYSKEEIEYGPILLKNHEKLLIEKYKNINNKYENIISNNNIDDFNKNKIKEKIDLNKLIIEKITNSDN